nr:unnamed protein product [Callosobruchus analis]
MWNQCIKIESLDNSVSVGEYNQGAKKRQRRKTKREIDYERRTPCCVILTTVPPQRRKPEMLQYFKEQKGAR